jgi:hypothetical protein
MKFKSLAAFSTTLFLLAGCETVVQRPAPYLQKHGDTTQLIVDGKPFLVLGGEIHNSSSSSLAYMEPIWPKLAKMHLNTVLTPVTWEQIEPEEGHFHFSVVDGLIRQARENHLHIAFLWMGSWKNGTSRYQPTWVKKDGDRFPLVVDKNGNKLEILSTFGEHTRDADSRAYAALMQHIKSVDGFSHTVILMQLENEIGVLGDSRDRSPAANAAFDGPVPVKLMSYLQDHKDLLAPDLKKTWDSAGNKTSGTWQEVFGSGTAADEIFMAWNYARYCNYVSAAGKAEYSLPTYMNNWIVQPDDKGPGDYPSGGPTQQVHDVYRAAGSSIDMLCPDIYLPNFTEVAGWFKRNGNPLFIPETRDGAAGIPNLFYAVGQLGAIGYSPFGIDEGEAENGPLTQAYSLLGHLAPQILEHQGTGKIAAVIVSGKPQNITMGDYTLNVDVARNRAGEGAASGYAMIIQLADDEFAIAGSSAQVTFTPNMPGPPTVGLAKVREDIVHDGKWIRGRWLNGDEVQFDYHLSDEAAKHQAGTGIRLPVDGPSVQYAWLYRY